MDIEVEYINAVLHLDQHEQHLALGQTKITSELFISHKAEHEYIKSHMAKTARIPSPSLFLRRFPDFDVYTPEEPIDCLAEELLDRYRRNVIVDFINEVDEDELRANLEHHVRRMQETVVTLAANDTSDSDSDYRKSFKERLQTYKEKKANLASTVYSTGCKHTDIALDGGVFPGQLVTVAGDPGLGKTWWLINAAVKNYLQGKHVLIISPEMSRQEIEQRIDANLHQVNYTRLRKGTLDPPEEAKYRKGVRIHSKRSVPLTVTDCSEDTFYTPTHIAAKIGVYRPAIVFVDSAYYLKPDRSVGGYQDNMNLCKHLKIISKRTGVPIVCIVQMDRESEKNGAQNGAALRQVYGGDAWAQASDVVLRLTGNRGEPYRKLVTLKNREGETWSEDLLKYQFKPYPEIESQDSYVAEEGEEGMEDDDIVSIEV